MLKSDRYICYNLVYVLKLKDNCYYVGVSSNLNARLAQHFEGCGSAWTRKHPPISLIEVFIGGEDKENQVTELYRNKYGINMVRGGKYTKDHYYIKICSWLKNINL